MMYWITILIIVVLLTGWHVVGRLERMSKALCLVQSEVRALVDEIAHIKGEMNTISAEINGLSGDVDNIEIVLEEHVEHSYGDDRYGFFKRFK